jgi:hypothetical protein
MSALLCGYQPACAFTEPLMYRLILTVTNPYRITVVLTVRKASAVIQEI